MASITQAERTDILKLLVGMFDAAPGATYLNEFADVFVSTNKNLGALAELLGQTAEFKAIYPSFLTAEGFANEFLATVGLQDNAEARDWVQSRVNAGEDKAVVIFQGLEALKASTSAEFATARQLLSNKAAVAEYFSVDLRLSSNSLEALQGVIENVTAEVSSVQYSKELLNKTDNTIYLSAGKAEGTITNDLFVGLLTSDSNINGYAGVDTLKSHVQGVVAPTIKNVENLQFQAQHRPFVESGD